MSRRFLLFFFTDPATTETYTLSLHDALPIFLDHARDGQRVVGGELREQPLPHRQKLAGAMQITQISHRFSGRSEEHTSELQSLRHLVCRLLLEKKKKSHQTTLVNDL